MKALKSLAIFNSLIGLGASVAARGFMAPGVKDHIRQKPLVSQDL